MYSLMMKMIKMTPEATRVPMTLPEFQGFVVPPHCKAKIRHTRHAMRRKVPGRSIWRSFSFHEALTGLAFLGVENHKMIMAAETPPIGRFT